MSSTSPFKHICMNTAADALVCSRPQWYDVFVRHRGRSKERQYLGISQVKRKVVHARDRYIWVVKVKEGRNQDVIFAKQQTEGTVLCKASTNTRLVGIFPAPIFTWPLTSISILSLPLQHHRIDCNFSLKHDSKQWKKTEARRRGLNRPKFTSRTM
ncbi:hypothetical protein BDN70DRAFT_343012 [Pholiota conissans]|uniref:Uncharacterized protein n=1 Tax=Pholiota conissans TaxID=109636 RepID=A0A9P5Z876_9AGAR|nr:hypothetical protein BDN70DRAFT_343012 [Pholiota conissans]